MGVFDWVTIGRSCKEQITTGNMSVSIGTSVAGVIGSKNTHTFGNAFDLVFDPMQFLMSGNSALAGVALGMVSGIGGNAKFAYGALTSATYQGPVSDIRRAPVYRKNTDYFMPTLKGKITPPPPDPIDAPTFAAVRVLGVLLVACPLAFEIAIRAKYGDSLNPTSYHKELEVLKFCAYAVTSRIAAVIRALENATSNVQIGERLSRELTEITTSISAMATATWEVLSEAAMETVRAGVQLVSVRGYIFNGIVYL